jgi:hypothetical protein
MRISEKFDKIKILQIKLEKYLIMKYPPQELINIEQQKLNKLLKEEEDA